MANPDSNLQGLCSSFQKAYKSVTDIRSDSNDYSQKNAMTFGLQVKQTASDNHLNTLLPYDEDIFHNPFNDSRFKKVPVTVLHSQEPYLTESSDLLIKSKIFQNPHSSNQSEIKIVKVWSMAVEKDSHSVNNSHQSSNVMEQVCPIIQADNLGNEYVLNPSEQTVDNKASRLERQRERKRERKRERYQNDPAFAERQRERQRQCQRERRKDPTYAERQRERRRERYQNDPAFAERQRKRRRERYQNDPAFAERQRERQRQCQRERRKDPTYAERQRERKSVVVK